MALLYSRFVGYNTIGANFNNPTLHDLELAKRDLLNQFGTRFGERVMLPKFGSIIWEMLFDQLTADNIAIIKADVERVIGEDPRWQLISCQTIDGPNSLTVNVEMIYLPSQQQVTLPLVYDKGTTTV